MWEQISASPEATADLARRIAVHAAAGYVVALYGELGSGKTVFTKGLAVGLGLDPERVTSPTFTLMHEYQGGRLPLFHFDLYRIETSAELFELGFPDYPLPLGLTVVEWAARAGQLLPSDHLAISLDFVADDLEGSLRRVRVQPTGPRSRQWAEAALEGAAT